MSIPIPFIAALQHAIDSTLKLDPRAQETVGELDQKVIQLHLRGLEIDIFLLIVDGGIEVSGFFDGEVDTVVSGTPFAIAAMSRDLQGMFKGDVDISGDLGVGRNVKRLFSELDVDWEEQLSHFIGDTAAHQLGRIQRELASLMSRTVTNFQHNTAEYLTEETTLLVTRHELQGFLDDVDDIRADTDRLTARMQLLEKHFSGENE